MDGGDEVIRKSRSTGSIRVREAFSAQAALASQSSSSTVPQDAFERRFWQRRHHRESESVASQSRPWLLWFLIIALSGGIGFSVFWSDTSISREGSAQAVGSDSAWRGVIRQERPRPLTPIGPSITEVVRSEAEPVTTVAAAASTLDDTRQPADRPAGDASQVKAKDVAPKPPVQQLTTTPAQGLLGDPTVLSIQGLLAKNGFAPGPADGLMGTRTRTAILAWQLQEGLATTGRASKLVLEQLLDPSKARAAADRIPIDQLAVMEREILESWCTTGRNAGNVVAYYQCMGDEVAKLTDGLRMPELRREASGNIAALATARLLCNDQASGSPQTYFKCLHAEVGAEKSLFVME